MGWEMPWKMGERPGAGCKLERAGSGVISLPEPLFAS